MKALMSLFATAAATAAPLAPWGEINYGDFAGTSVNYRSVRESSATDALPLYSFPTITGDQLDFDPTAFDASATGAGVDLTDGQLCFELEGKDRAIPSISIRERGDYSLIGAGTDLTQVTYALSASITVLEVDDVTLTSPVLLGSASVSGMDDLTGGEDLLTPWALEICYDVSTALTVAGVPFTTGATKIEVVVENQLAAIAEDTSIASIGKTDLKVDPTFGPLGTAVCSPANANSTGGPAHISATGPLESPTLYVSGLPLDKNGYFLSSDGFLAAPFSPPGSEGLFCLAGGDNLGRYSGQVLNSGSGGTVCLGIDPTAVPWAGGMGQGNDPTISVIGQTWYFSYWYRDDASGGGNTTNFSDVVSIDFFVP